jgi:hypothetical protein
MHRLNQSQTRRAERLAEKHTNAELGALAVTASAKEMEIIAWAIYIRTVADKKAAGTYVFPGGYSGRKQNRRR